MTRRRSNEDELEQLAKETLAELAWTPLKGSDIAPGTGFRESWDDLVMPSVLYDALQRFNPTVPTHYLQQALTEITAAKSQDPVAENFRIHEWLVSRFRQITYIDDAGRDNTPEIRLLHPDAERNTWHVVNQVTLRNRYHERRLDLVLYCNGMPVVIVELKSATDRAATIRGAHAQLATYLDEFPLAFRFHVLTVIADGISAEYGTAFTPFIHFSPWNVDEVGEPDHDPSLLPLELLLPTCCVSAASPSGWPR